MAIFLNPLWKFAKITNVWSNSSSEMADIIFIIISCIQNNSILFLHRFIKRLWIEIFSSQFLWVNGMIEPKCNDFLTRTNVHFFKCMPIVLVNFKNNIRKTLVLTKRIYILFCLLHGS